MSWTLVIWLMSAGVCITLAAVHLLVWLRGRNAQASLAFSLWTTAVAISALFELAMIHSPTQEKYAVLLGASAFPFAVMAITYIAFIRLYLRAGRRWRGRLVQHPGESSRALRRRMLSTVLPRTRAGWERPTRDPLDRNGVWTNDSPKTNLPSFKSKNVEREVVV